MLHPGLGFLCCNAPKLSASHKSPCRKLSGTTTTVFMFLSSGLATSTADMFCLWHFDLWCGSAFGFTTARLCEWCFQRSNGCSASSTTTTKRMRDEFSPWRNQFRPSRCSFRKLTAKTGMNSTVPIGAFQEIGAAEWFARDPVQQPAFNRWPDHLNEV